MSRERKTSARVVEAAVQLFAQQGYEATSMRDLASGVAIKPASLYNHFSSKADLLWKIVSKAIADLEAAQAATFDETATAADQLDRFVDAHVRYHAEFSDAAKVVNNQLDVLPQARYREAVAFRRRYEQRLREILHRGESEGFEVLDARTTTFAILQMGMAVANWYEPSGPETIDEICDYYVSYARRLVRA